MKRRFITLACLLLILLLLSPLTALPALGDAAVFINEIHYDNASTDTGEAIEIAGPAGTDLTGWSLVLYNGNGGASYNTTALSDIIPDLGGGFGVVVVATPGLQNGAPDGVALVDASNNVIQFLSYEGSFTATNGPANGQTSTDIGVSESSGTAVGDSLQLTGSGTIYEDFTWAGSAPNTFGAFNTGQSFGGTTPPVTCTNTTPIADVQGPGDSTPLAGQEVTIRGFVTADFGSEIVVQEASSSPRSGVLVFSSGNGASRGDEVCVTGIASEFFGQTQVGGNSNPNATVQIISTGNSLPAPALVNTGDIATGASTAEQWEDVLVRTENVEVVNDNLGFGEFSIDDGSGPVRVDDKGSFSYSPTNGDALDYVQGPLYFSFSDYKIEPRDDDDIGVPPPPVEACGDSITPIYAIQGSGATSPLAGNAISTEGVVVGDFQDNDGDLFDTDLDGFFIQDETGDGDPATSDGIFVEAPGSMDVAVGDKVRVAGQVEESFGRTQISSVSNLLLCSTGSSVAPTGVTLPVTSIDDLEAFEGMLVTFSQPLYIIEFFNFDRFGEIVLSTGRQFQPTAVFEPGSTEAANLAQQNALSRITLDDGRSNQNPDPARHPNGNVFDLNNTFRGGDTVENVTGVLDYGFGLYRIQPTAGALYTSQNPRPAQPDDVGGNVTVASFNVLNYFTSLDFIQEPSGTNDPADDVCGPPGFKQECRGADNAEEFARQRAKIIDAISIIDADVVGLIEIENNETAAIEDLVSGLNTVMGTGTYDYIDTGYVGTDAIKVALIYKPGNVSPVGDYAVLDTPDFLDPNGLGDDKNRAALAQTFIGNTNGGIFTVVVNHLKSKGSECGAGDDDPEQGSCNLTRTLAAQKLADWLATDPTGSGDSDVLIIGDLNSYDKEDPIDTLLGNGYSDLVAAFGGEYAYSYVFDGQLGYLDYALANQTLAPNVNNVTVWHINADEPDILDYDTSFKKAAQDALYQPNAFRSSDHDPVIVGLDVCDEIAPTIDVTVSPDTLSPANHKYVAVEATVTVSDNFDPNPTVTLVSVVSNEPDDGLGDGDTADDIQIQDSFHFNLRAERAGTGDGRIYTITYQVEDACGNVTTTSATVTVPHDSGNEKQNGQDKSTNEGDASVNDADGGQPADNAVENPDEGQTDENSGESLDDDTAGSTDETTADDAASDPAETPGNSGGNNGKAKGKNK